MKVAIAIDGSDCSLRAVQTLVKLFGTLGGLEVQVINVQLPVRFFDLLPVDKQTLVAQRDARAGEEATDAARLILSVAKIAHRLEVVVGDPAASIVKCANGGGCELIVMGTRGMGAAAGLVLGSVATKVVHMADIPVTLVK